MNSSRGDSPIGRLNAISRTASEWPRQTTNGTPPLAALQPTTVAARVAVKKVRGLARLHFSAVMPKPSSVWKKRRKRFFFKTRNEKSHIYNKVWCCDNKVGDIIVTLRINVYIYATFLSEVTLLLAASQVKETTEDHLTPVVGSE